MTAEPKWLDLPTLIRLHDAGLERFGGPEGLRDEGLLISALQRPLNRWSYEGVDDLADLAATYGVAIARNHSFVDGNKRTGFLATVMFLRRNGRDLAATELEALETMLKVATGEWDIPSFAAWISPRNVPWRRR